MTAYVLPLAEAEITEYEIWIPIAMLYIQSEFALGRVPLRTLSRELFEHWKGQLPDPGASSRRESIEHERGETQGLAAATQSVRAERVRAEEMAYRDAAEALAMLRFFAPANFDPRVVSYCTPLGQENLGSRKHLILQNGELRTLVSGSLSRRGARPWIIDDEGLHMLRVGALELLSNLIRAQNRSPFQERLVASLLLYSRSSLAKEISDKFVYLLVPLESMLLKNNTEPIQQNLAERMAFLIGRDLDERKDIIATVKAAYALRSKFLHHGGTADDVEVLKKFMRMTWKTMKFLVDNAGRFETTEAAISALEDERLA